MARMKTLLTAVTFAALAGALAVAGVTFELSMGNAVRVLDKAIEARGAAFAAGLANDIVFAVATAAEDDVQDALRLFLDEDKEARGVSVHKTGEKALASMGGEIPREIAAALRGGTRFMTAGGRYYFSSPVTAEQKVIGHVLVSEQHTGGAEMLSGARMRGAAVFLLVLLVATAAAWWFASRVSAPLERMATVTNAIASGDLTQRARTETGFVEVGELSAAINTMAEALHSQVKSMARTADGLMESSSQLAASTSQLASTSSEQAASISEATSTAEEIKQTGKISAAGAHEIVAVAEKSVEISGEGLGAVDSSSVEVRRLQEQVSAIADGIDGIRRKVGKVEEIIATVKDIAEQSNLLAVNASIEAAKAGEFGRGFAVVALEVKSLADQSKRAAIQVRGTLAEMQSAIDEAVGSARTGKERAEQGVHAIEHTGTVIRRLGEVIERTAERARHIAISANEQAVGLEQIAQAMGTIHEAAAETTASMHDVEKSSDRLAKVSAQMREVVGRYRVAGEGGG